MSTNIQLHPISRRIILGGPIDVKRKTGQIRRINPRRNSIPCAETVSEAEALSTPTAIDANVIEGLRPPEKIRDLEGC